MYNSAEMNEEIIISGCQRVIAALYEEVRAEKPRSCPQARARTIKCKGVPQEMAHVHTYLSLFLAHGGSCQTKEKNTLKCV